MPCAVQELWNNALKGKISGPVIVDCPVCGDRILAIVQEDKSVSIGPIGTSSQCTHPDMDHGRELHVRFSQTPLAESEEALFE